MIKLTQVDHDEPVYVDPAKFLTVTACNGGRIGQATLWFGGADYFTVRESADEVARLVDEAKDGDLPHDACFEQWAAHAAKMAVRGNRLAMTEDEYGQHSQFTVPFPVGATRSKAPFDGGEPSTPKEMLEWAWTRPGRNDGKSQVLYSDGDPANARWVDTETYP